MEENEKKMQQATVSVHKHNRERNPGKIVKKILLFVAAILTAVILTFLYSMVSEYTRKESRPGKDVTITVKKGESAEQVARDLQEKGVIRYVFPFMLKAYRMGLKGNLKYGSYTLNDGMTLTQVVDTLIKESGSDGQGTFVIPEGDSIARIARRLEKKNIMTREEFLSALDRAVPDFAYADQLPKGEGILYPLEGYLYPDTYYVDENTTPDTFVADVLDHFTKKFGTERIEQAKKLGMSVEEVLTRASMIQKETEKAEEYPVIAGVIQNRLDKNMKLQFDSTIVYAVTEGMYGKEKVVYSDLKVDSPYNTYVVGTLPAGPICSPSLAAIDGVLNPDKNEYLFFQYDAEKDDGSNLYFKTYEEHKDAASTAEEAATEKEKK